MHGLTSSLIILSAAGSAFASPIAKQNSASAAQKFKTLTFQNVPSTPGQTVDLSQCDGFLLNGLSGFNPGNLDSLLGGTDGTDDSTTNGGGLNFLGGIFNFITSLFGGNGSNGGTLGLFDPVTSLLNGGLTGGSDPTTGSSSGFSISNPSSPFNINGITAVCCSQNITEVGVQNCTPVPCSLNMVGTDADGNQVSSNNINLGGDLNPVSIATDLAKPAVNFALNLLGNNPVTDIASTLDPSTVTGTGDDTAYQNDGGNDKRQVSFIRGIIVAAFDIAYQIENSVEATAEEASGAGTGL